MNRLCQNCGNETTDPNAKYCTKCGWKFPEAYTPPGSIWPNQQPCPPVYPPVYYPPYQAPAAPKKNNSWIGWLIAALLLLFVGLPTFIGLCFWIFGGDNNHNDYNGNGTQEPTTSDSNSYTNSDYGLGEPANPNDDVNPNLWNEPQSSGVMITTTGDVYYEQSGKPNVRNLYGTIPEGQALVLDSYLLWQAIDENGTVKDYPLGNILVILGPKNLDNYHISYKDGAAQLCGIDQLQNLLDSNISVKMARGDWDFSKNQWSYSHWADANLWIPNGYVYHRLVLTYKTDTYPGKNTPTQ